MCRGSWRASPGVSNGRRRDRHTTSCGVECGGPSSSAAEDGGVGRDVSKSDRTACGLTSVAYQRPSCYTAASRLPRNARGGGLRLAPKIEHSKPKIPPKAALCRHVLILPMAHRFLTLSLGHGPASQDTLGLRPSPAPSPTAHASSFVNLDGAESTGRSARPTLACPQAEASVSGVRP